MVLHGGFAAVQDDIAMRKCEPDLLPESKAAALTSTQLSSLH
jgi:hypothetical protein